MLFCVFFKVEEYGVGCVCTLINRPKRMVGGLEQTNISKIVLDNNIVHGCHNEFHLLCIGGTGKMSIDLLVVRLVK